MGLLQGIGKVLGLSGQKRSGYWGQAATALGQQAGLGAQYGQLARQGQERASRFTPQYDAAVQNQADYLRRNPYDPQRMDSLYNQRTAVGNAAFDRSGAAIQNSLARRGIGGGVLAGALAGNEIGRARLQAGVRGQLGNEAYASEGMRLSQLAQLLGQERAGGLSMQMAGAGAQGGVYGNLAQGYAHLGGSEDQFNQANSPLGAIAQLAGAYGQYQGMGMGRAGAGGMAQEPGVTASAPIDPQLLALMRRRLGNVTPANQEAFDYYGGG